MTQDPPPEDGELGYTGPLEDGSPVLEEDEVEGQITLEELLEERDPPIDQRAELFRASRG